MSDTGVTVVESGASLEDRWRIFVPDRTVGTFLAVADALRAAEVAIDAEVIAWYTDESHIVFGGETPHYVHVLRRRTLPAVSP